MRVTRERRAENRQRILAEASRLFREKGVQGVGVAEITQAAGMTHGGFYGHFASKEILLAEAIAYALTGAAEQLAVAADIEEYAQGYASERHLQTPGSGCPMAALGSEMSRQPTEVREAFARGVREFIVAATAGAGTREAALTRVSGLVGAMVLARAVKGVDDDLAAEVLSAIRTAPRS